MNNYKEHLELHKVGLVNLFDSIKFSIENRLKCLINFSYDHDSSNKNRKIYRLAKDYNIFLMLYLTNIRPTFMIAIAPNSVFIEELEIVPLNLYSNIQQNKLMFRLRNRYPTYYKKYIDDYCSDSDFVKEYSKDISLLNYDVLDSAFLFVRNYII